MPLHPRVRYRAPAHGIDDACRERVGGNDEVGLAILSDFERLRMAANGWTVNEGEVLPGWGEEYLVSSVRVRLGGRLQARDEMVPGDRGPGQRPALEGYQPLHEVDGDGDRHVLVS